MLSHKGSVPLLRMSSPWRAWLLMAINIASFCFVNAFWQYVTTGRWLNFSYAAYARDLATPLGEVFLYPLSILHHPYMILVMSLLLATVVFIPIIIAVFYRLYFAAIFVLILAAVGHAPVLALAVAVGCALAAWTRLRSNVPLLAMLLGLVPVALYLYLFGNAQMDSAAVPPLQRWLLAVPLVAAVVVGLLAAAAMLGMARLTRYRPGVVWPVLLALVIAPVAIFFAKVGQDELEYALIVSRLADGDALLESQTLEAWSRANKADGLTAGSLKKLVQDDLASRQSELSRQCEKFLSRRPRSSRAPAVLWVRAQCASLQLDDPSFDMGLLKYTCAFASRDSLGLWQRLRNDYPNTPQAAWAQWRLAELALRDGDPLGALTSLKSAEQVLKNAPDEADRRPQDTPAELFSSAPSLPQHRHAEEALFAVQKLVWMMEQNNVLSDPLSAKAMQAYLDINPYQGDYAGNLLAMLDPARKFDKSPMGDNLRLAAAMATRDRAKRLTALAALAEDLKPDVALEANYELGRLAMLISEGSVPSTVHLRKPEEYFKRVLAASANPWQEPAAQHVAWLTAAAKTR